MAICPRFLPLLPTHFQDIPTSLAPRALHAFSLRGNPSNQPRNAVRAVPQDPRSSCRRRAHLWCVSALLVLCCVAHARGEGEVAVGYSAAGRDTKYPVETGYSRTSGCGCRIAKTKQEFRIGPCHVGVRVQRLRLSLARSSKAKQSKAKQSRALGRPLRCHYWMSMPHDPHFPPPPRSFRLVSIWPRSVCFTNFLLDGLSCPRGLLPRLSGQHQWRTPAPRGRTGWRRRRKP